MVDYYLNLVEHTSCSLSWPLECSESVDVESLPRKIGASNFLLKSWAVPGNSGPIVNVETQRNYVTQYLLSVFLSLNFIIRRQSTLTEDYRSDFRMNI